MTLIGKQHIWELLRSKGLATVAISVWMANVEKDHWDDRNDVLRNHPSVRFLTPNMAIFAFPGSQIEVTTQIAFNTSIVVILAAGLSLASVVKSN